MGRARAAEHTRTRVRPSFSPPPYVTSGAREQTSHMHAIEIFALFWIQWWHSQEFKYMRIIMFG